MSLTPAPSLPAFKPSGGRMYAAAYSTLILGSACLLLAQFALIGWFIGFGQTSPPPKHPLDFAQGAETFPTLVQIGCLFVAFAGSCRHSRLALPSSPAARIFRGVTIGVAVLITVCVGLVWFWDWLPPYNLGPSPGESVDGILWPGRAIFGWWVLLLSLEALVSALTMQMCVWALRVTSARRLAEVNWHYYPPRLAWLYEIDRLDWMEVQQKRSAG